MSKTFESELDEMFPCDCGFLEGFAFDGKCKGTCWQAKTKKRILAAAEAMGKREITGDTSDGYHTFNELYEYRVQYNAALFNEWALQGKYDVHKSWKHSDGENCFGGGWFIVMAELPTGQISNHYPEKDWERFNIPEKAKANEYDGHTPQEALERLARLSQELGSKEQSL